MTINDLDIYVTAYARDDKQLEEKIKEHKLNKYKDWYKGAMKIYTKLKAEKDKSK